MLLDMKKRGTFLDIQPKIHHVDIWINKVEESITFYKALGFNKIKEIDDEKQNKKIIIMKLNDIILEMKYHYINNCNHNEVICNDNKVFGLSVSNISYAKQFIEDMHLVNEEINIMKGILGNLYFLIHDPNGILLEIIEDKICKK